MTPSLEKDTHLDVMTIACLNLKTTTKMSTSQCGQELEEGKGKHT